MPLLSPHTRNIRELMTDKHVVRFEPVGIDIEVGEDQTILRAAAEQGIMLMHGCKEGQCASCKSFVLDGDDFELDRYSTFALPDYERDEGFTLLCRTHAYEDLTIELLNYDEEMIRSGLPIQQAETMVVSIDPVTPDMRHLVLELVEPREIKFFPGQYIDIAVPGTDQTRSFSIANTSCRDSGHLEFVIRVYPDGLFSHLLDTRLAVGDRLDITGPYGVFTLREGRDDDLIFIGGGAGRTCASRRSCELSRRRCRVSATCRRCRSRPTATAGRARSASSPTSCGGKWASSPTSTRMCVAHHRWSRRPWRCSLIWGHRRNASTTTSSPRRVNPIPLQ